jgi:integrase
VGEELVTTNPVRDAPAPKQRSPRVPLVLEPEERRRLVRTCLEAHDPLLLAIACLAELGLRSGELRALRFDDLHAPYGHTLRIERTTRVRMGNKDVTEEGDTKSAASKRPIEVPSFLLRALQAHWMTRASPDNSNYLLWESRRGGYLPGSALAPALYRGLKLAQIDRFLCYPDRSPRGRDRSMQLMTAVGLAPLWEGAPLCPRCHDLLWHLRVHDLRHSALSAWLADKHTPQAVARRAGHSKITLLSIYGHGLDEQDREIARQDDEAWTEGE